MRVTYVGKLDWEIHTPMADLARLYEAIRAAGQPHDIADFGVQAAGTTTRLVYAEIAATDCDIHGGEAVMQGGRVVGVCTSGAYGHATGKSLTFAYVKPEATAGLEVVIPGESHALTLLDAPAWGPANLRQKA